MIAFTAGRSPWQRRPRRNGQTDSNEKRYETNCSGAIVKCLGQPLLGQKEVTRYLPTQSLAWTPFPTPRLGGDIALKTLGNR